jgi:hypothetical protein
VYLSERMLVAVTPVEVVVIALDAAVFGRRRRRVWTHAELRTEVIPSRGGLDALGPALRLSRRGRSPVLEIAPIADDVASAAVIEQLLADDPPPDPFSAR